MVPQAAQRGFRLNSRSLDEWLPRAVTLLLVAVAVPAIAGQEDPLHTDQAKRAAFQAIGERRVDALSRTAPLRSRLSVYIDADVDGFRLESAEVRVTSSGARRLHRYSELDNRALRAGGLHRALRTGVAAGRHLLETRLEGWPRGVPDRDATPGSLVEASFEAGNGERPLVVPVSAFEFTDRPWRWVVPYGWRSGVSDPQARMARYLRHTGQTHAAMFELFEMQAEQGGGVMPSPQFQAEMAFGHLAFGMVEDARLFFDSLQRNDPTSPIVADLRIGLGRQYLRENRPRTALKVLGSERPADGPRALYWLDLVSRSLIAVGEHRTAADLLAEPVRRMADAAGSSFEVYPAVLWFNRAVALIGAGAKGQGEDILDRLARSPGDSAAARAMREQANLTLAFHLLRQGESEAAAAVFRRHPAYGLRGGIALVGRGWAEWAAADSGTESGRRASLRRAADAWSIAADQDIATAGAQEALMARAYAEAGLGAGMRTGLAFDHAINALTAEHSRITAVIQDVEGTRNQSPVCSPFALTDNDASTRFTESAAFARAWRDHQDLCVLAAFLDASPKQSLEVGCIRRGELDPSQRPPTDLMPWSACDTVADFGGLSRPGTAKNGRAAFALDAARQQRDHLTDMWIERLVARRVQTERYLTDALKGLARHFSE